MSHQWGPEKCQLEATPCVALSLALFVVGDSDPTGGFHLRNLSVGRPLGNRGTRFGYGCCIPRCRVCVI
jgi:hypothetical protein